MTLDEAVAKVAEVARGNLTQTLDRIAADLKAQGATPESVADQVECFRKMWEESAAQSMPGVGELLRSCLRIIELQDLPVSTLDRLTVEAEESLRSHLEGALATFRSEASEQGVPAEQVEAEIVRLRAANEVKIADAMPVVRDRLAATLGRLQ